MKKGDINRGKILDCAEKLFFTRGYGATSIQHILDAMGISKGAFYHYFPSKEAVLSEIFARKYALRAETVRAELASGRLDPVAQLNLLFRFLNLFDREDAPYAALIIRLCYLENDRALYLQLRQTLIDAAAEPLTAAVFSGIRTGDFFARRPDQTAAIVLSIALDLTDRAARTVAADPENSENALSVIDLLEAGSDAIETLLGAPYRSVRLFDAAQLLTAIRLVSQELEAHKENVK